MSPLRWLLALLLALLVHAGLLLWFVINSNNLKDVEPFKDKDEGMVISLAGMAEDAGLAAGMAGDSGAGSSGGDSSSAPTPPQTLPEEKPPASALAAPQPQPKVPLQAQTKVQTQVQTKAQPQALPEPPPKHLSEQKQELPPIAKTFEISEAELRAMREAEALEEAHRVEQQQAALQQRREAEARERAAQQLLANQKNKQKKNEWLSRQRLERENLQQQRERAESEQAARLAVKQANAPNPDAEGSGSQTLGVSDQPNSPPGQSSDTTAGSGTIGSGAAPANSTNLMKAYRAQIQKLLAKYKKYPKRAKRRGHQGRVSVRVTVDRNGNISGLKIAQSSGHNILDQATLKALRAMPFPPPPADLSPERKDFSFTIPVDYRLR